MTRVIGTKAELRAAIAEARAEGRRVGFVPTMGALHEGHLSLVQAASERTDFVVVSIFVNPLQFGPAEDFDAYPRTLGDDLALLEAESVDVVFAPSVREMYGDGAEVTVDPGPLGKIWEGASRPGHFAGAATIVCKLFGTVRPDQAFFGEKDYQQLQIISRMSLDLDLNVEVVGCPTVRDADGLALSSRNRYLSADERQTAVKLPRALGAAAACLGAGERDARVIEDAMLQVLGEEPGIWVDYVAVVDPATLEPLECVQRSARAILAARVGTTRLIDNRALDVANPW
ncbi:MAG: pantoate--beta-alanine ligase [Coriobacteriia bacterium]